MINIFQKAQQKKITPELEYIADIEDVDIDLLLDYFSKGEVVVLKNNLRDISPVAIGRGLRTKVNANIGSSPDLFNIETEINKLHAAIEAGADTVMDLSTGGNLTEFRMRILNESSIPLGTVPLYEAAVKMRQNGKSIIDMKIDDFLDVIKRQTEQGVDYMTIHSGVTIESLKSLSSQKRIIGVTSRGGSIISEWIKQNNKENPLFEYFDEILAGNNVVISLGDGLRPGCVSDANDRGQVHEMIILGKLARRAREKGVQVIIEGPGHVPLNMIVDNMKLEKKLCDNAPYYVLGPIVTDIAPGYDHITSAIGGAIAASAGADYLCYVTPAEHLRLPGVEDVREGVIASRIAAHAADIVKSGERAMQWDNKMSEARKNRDWETMFKLSVDPVKAKKFRSEIPSDSDQCSMCGEFCAMKKQPENS